MTESQCKVLDLTEVIVRQGRWTFSTMIASVKERDAQNTLMGIESQNELLQLVPEV